jgi:hypothetical protein
MVRSYKMETYFKLEYLSNHILNKNHQICRNDKKNLEQINIFLFFICHRLIYLYS